MGTARLKMARSLSALVVLLASPAAAAEGSALAPDSIEYVLAASWQPSFCLSANGSSRPECRTLSADRFDATHFTLHGLWPDDLDDRDIYPCYCDRGAPRSCRGSLRRDARIDLSQEILDELVVVMPGVRSGLHLHEWAKHGSCYEDDRSGADAGADPDEYFAESIALLAQLNDSPVRALFADSLGGTLTRSEIEAAFDEAFGAGAGDRVVVRCSGGNISALWVNLEGDITPQSDLAGLILAAPPASASTNTRSCGGGRVVEVRRN